MKRLNLLVSCTPSMLASTLMIALVIAACTVDQAGTKVTTEKTREDIQWACFALKGGFAVYKALSPLVTASMSPVLIGGVTKAQSIVVNLCDNQGKLTNLDDAFNQVMEAAGLVAKAVADAPAS